MFLSNGIEHLLSTEGQQENEEEEEDRVNDDSSVGNDGNNVYSDSLFTGIKGYTSVTASGPGTRASGPGTRASGPGTRATGSEKSLLPQGTLAKMRDLMVSTDKVASMLRTGENNESSYTSYQHTQSIHPINPPYQHTLSHTTFPVNTILSQYIL